ncbi:hypothetical protein CKM354_001186700 [Cercospora kikuchii]|uniref:Uncharacterized protein n=1 Tax=Cercospora kikuchii TaxID=84275 RepID=A0A9P3CTU9_9PEZI|nr:uncharacterized protein CKM354_001186700 [Cercospora kikuchii]GIZ48821.1 hypothetical protein CKM354_001186700 [Cercospora kikuchii]
MYIGGGLGPFRHPPVHETITLAALIHSEFKLDPATTYLNLILEKQADILEFLRGIVWNDDPSNLLFNNQGWFNPSNENYSRGIGKDWAVQFADGAIFDADCTKDGWLGHKNLIARSHFGDLQFLHSMAEVPGEAPEETRREIMMWLQIMYRVALGEITNEVKLRDIKTIGDGTETTYPLRDLFDEGTIPNESDTVNTLLTTNGTYRKVMHDRRALGSCLHLIQDSYARGHCHRELLSDSIPRRYGRIMNFHSFRGQNAEEHQKYDFGDKEFDNVNVSDISVYEDMDGCTDAVHASTKLIDFWTRKAPWDEVREWLEDEVFAISPDVTPSNTRVD